MWLSFNLYLETSYLAQAKMPNELPRVPKDLFFSFINILQKYRSN